ncbi:hypothetical protein D3C78_1733570 [compost metagenome]
MRVARQSAQDGGAVERAGFKRGAVRSLSAQQHLRAIALGGVDHAFDLFAMGK